MPSNLSEKVKFIQERKTSDFLKATGIVLTKLTEAEVCGEIEISEYHHQPFGIMHGGVSVVLAETLASIGGWLNIDADSQIAVGQEINANHLRPVIKGKIQGSAKIIHKGRTSQVWDIEIIHNTKLICKSRCTIAVVQKKLS